VWQTSKTRTFSSAPVCDKRSPPNLAEWQRRSVPFLHPLILLDPNNSFAATGRCKFKRKYVRNKSVIWECDRSIWASMKHTNFIAQKSYPDEAKNIVKMWNFHGFGVVIPKQNWGSVKKGTICFDQCNTSPHHHQQSSAVQQVFEILSLSPYLSVLRCPFECNRAAIIRKIM